VGELTETTGHLTDLGHLESVERVAHSVVTEPAFSVLVLAARNPPIKDLLNKISSHITAGSQVLPVNFKFRIAELLSLRFIC